jgi:hypothetical protein
LAITLGCAQTVRSRRYSKNVESAGPADVAIRAEVGEKKISYRIPNDNPLPKFFLEVMGI